MIRINSFFAIVLSNGNVKIDVVGAMVPKRTQSPFWIPENASIDIPETFPSVFYAPRHGIFLPTTDLDARGELPCGEPTTRNIFIYRKGIMEYPVEFGYLKQPYWLNDQMIAPLAKKIMFEQCN